MKTLPSYVFLPTLDQEPLRRLTAKYKTGAANPRRPEVLRAIGRDLARIPAEFGQRLALASETEIEQSAKNASRSLIDLRNHLPAGEQALFLGILFQSVAQHHPATGQHQLRVAKLCRRLGNYAGLTKQEQGALFQAAYLHDVGKIIVPANKLDKSGSLNPKESDLIRRGHIIFGYYLLRQFPYLNAAAEILGFNHAFDGNMPSGFALSKMTTGGEILSMVDCFDALTEPRRYRERPISKEEGLNFIADREKEGFRYDPRLVAELGRLVKNGVEDLAG